jgi:hypothetical protein
MALISIGRWLSGTLTRMQEHILDDGIGTLAMLHDLVEIALKHVRNLADLSLKLAVKLGRSERFAQFINQFD